MQAVIAVLTFMLNNREAIKALILQVEGLIPDAPGASKAGMVKGWIAAAMGAEAQLEAAWPLVKPLFDLLVAATKTQKPAAAPVTATN